MLSFTEYFMVREDDEEERTKKLKKGRFFGETILFFPRQCGGGIPCTSCHGPLCCLAGDAPAFCLSGHNRAAGRRDREWMARLVMKKKKIA